MHVRYLIRTCNLLIWSQTPYLLFHADEKRAKLIHQIQMFHFKNIMKAEINFHYIIFSIKFFTPLIFQLLRKYYSFWKNLFLPKKKYFTRNDSQINKADARDRIRTCNLLIRSQTLYPLGHADVQKNEISLSNTSAIFYDVVKEKIIILCIFFIF